MIMTWVHRWPVGNLHDQSAMMNESHAAWKMLSMNEQDGHDERGAGWRVRNTFKHDEYASLRTRSGLMPRAGLALTPSPSSRPSPSSASSASSPSLWSLLSQHALTCYNGRSIEPSLRTWGRWAHRVAASVDRWVIGSWGPWVAGSVARRVAVVGGLYGFFPWHILL